VRRIRRGCQDQRSLYRGRGGPGKQIRLTQNIKSDTIKIITFKPTVTRRAPMVEL